MNNINIKNNEDWYAQCPFLGSCNSCGVLNEGINVCPKSDEDTDMLIPPSNCPLLVRAVTVTLITISDSTLLQDIETYLAVCSGQYDESGEADALLERVKDYLNQTH